MRIVLDLTRLVEEGKLSPEQAQALKALAARDAGTLAINVLTAFGAVAVAAGVIALEPGWETVALIGIASTCAGLATLWMWSEQWGLFGSTLVVVGGLAMAAAVAALGDSGFASVSMAALLLFALAIVARSGLLMALSPPALAAALGSSTGYLEATYLLVVREASIVILVFSALAGIAYLVAERSGAAYERLAIIFARMSLVLVNLGFWVGSLWGDDPGASWTDPDAYYASLWSDIRTAGLHVPDVVFVIAWAVTLVGTGLWAARANRRFVLNAVVVFAAIHFYTQWYERLGDAPWSLIAAGLLGIGGALLMWRYNRRPDRPPVL